MTRDTALQILTKYLSNRTLLKHSLYTESAMRNLAPFFAEDVELWGITGLLHEADYEKTKGDPENHGKLLFELEPNSIPTVVEHAIKAHNFGATHIAPESPLDFALYCSDELIGIIAEIAEITKDKTIAQVTPDIVLQKLQDKNYAKGAEKEKIYLCEEKLGIPLQKFIEIILKAMQGVKEEVEENKK